MGTMGDKYPNHGGTTYMTGCYQGPSPAYSARPPTLTSRCLICYPREKIRCSPHRARGWTHPGWPAPLPWPHRKGLHSTGPPASSGHRHTFRGRKLRRIGVIDRPDQLASKIQPPCVDSRWLTPNKLSVALDSHLSSDRRQAAIKTREQQAPDSKPPCHTPKHECQPPK
jgi:hypothetical protein